MQSNAAKAAISKIRKRTGKVVQFNSEKISDAIRKANMESVDDTFTSKRLSALTKAVIASIPGKKIPTVEEIQDLVEKTLIRNNCASTAKAYILYRAEHAKLREARSDLMDIYHELTFR